MTCEVPSFLDDLSKVLVVPDQQEVFVSDSGSNSVIIEVLEYQEVPDAEAAQFFFNDLSKENSALSSRVLESTLTRAGGQSPMIHTVALLKGEFDAKKKGATTPDHVIVRLAVIRIPEHRADIVITMNEKTHDASEPERQEMVDPALLDITFRGIIDSFRIIDYGLFA